MTSRLLPGYTLTIGNQRWTEQLVHLEVALAAGPSIDTLTMVFPAGAPLDASPGDPVDLTLNGGEDEQAVFAGSIDSIRRAPDAIRVRGLNAGSVLAALRPAATYEQVSAGSVIRNLCDEAGVDAGDVEDGISLVYYAADPSRSAMDHVARVAGWSGALVRVSVDNRVEAVVVNATQADVALKYGRELTALHRRKVPAAIQSFTVAGEGGAGDAASPDALRPTTDFFSGHRPSGPSKRNRWCSEPALRTAAAAASAGAATQRMYNATREPGAFTAFLQPALRPGTVMEIKDAPDGLADGVVWLRSVTHRIGRQGAVTRAGFLKGGDTFDPSALLGSLLTAGGALL
jgi:hypothetical protein